MFSLVDFSSGCRVSPELHYHTAAALHHLCPYHLLSLNPNIRKVLTVQCCLLDTAVDDADQATKNQDDTSRICCTLIQ
jgi:hypothetical protein